jgi:hypothetical protein
MPQADKALEPVHVLKTGGRRVRVGLRFRDPGADRLTAKDNGCGRP